MQSVGFSLNPIPPFRLDLTAWALKRRPRNRIDSWDGVTYSRVIVSGTQPMMVKVTQAGSVAAPLLEVTVLGKRINIGTRAVVTHSLERLLGLRIDLGSFYEFADHDLRLRTLARRFSGLKPPRFPSVFEVLVNGISCQQLSLEAGLSILNRLVDKTGLSFGEGPDSRHAFPRPEDVVDVPVQSLRTMGFSTQKANALRTVSRAATIGGFDPESLIDCNNEEALARLIEFRGVGRWTAEYVLMRGLGRLDVFPGDDVGARGSLARWLNVKGPMDYPRVEKTLKHWGTYKGLIYFYLLLDGLEQRGLLQVPSKAA